MWHIDGNDKLAKYGFCLHGCMDGLVLHIMFEQSCISMFNCLLSSFSRMLIWLEVTPTNHNPSVICKYFLDAVGRAGGM